MSDDTLTLAVILGSVRQGRFGPTVADWFTDRAREHGSFAVDLIDAAETPLPAELPPSSADLVAVDRRPAPMVALADRLAAADVFVVVTPEYNHSFPAVLKHLIDWHYTQWQAKPVGFVSYGGQSGGVRAVEHLRQVFAELHTVTVRDLVSFDNLWERFDTEGRLLDPDGPNAAAKTLLDQLSWWATALRTARSARPYGITG